MAARVCVGVCSWRVHSADVARSVAAPLFQMARKRFPKTYRSRSEPLSFIQVIIILLLDSMNIEHVFNPSLCQYSKKECIIIQSNGESSSLGQKKFEHLGKTLAVTFPLYAFKYIGIGSHANPEA